MMTPPTDLLRSSAFRLQGADELADDIGLGPLGLAGVTTEDYEFVFWNSDV